jgi:hypothetical protein
MDIIIAGIFEVLFAIPMLMHGISEEKLGFIFVGGIGLLAGLAYIITAIIKK